MDTRKTWASKISRLFRLRKVIKLNRANPKIGVNNKKIRRLLLNYSFEDLARSFFVLNLWLPNVSSPIKAQYLYATLESLAHKLPKKNKISQYDHFEDLVKKLLKILPAFPMVEDYLPENDWGEIKYSLNRKFYKIFYGCDLSNPYDFYYAFEMTHKKFTDYYTENIGRAPLEELQICLSTQNSIIDGIPSSTQNKKTTEIGTFELPTNHFWIEANDFLDNFNPSKEFSNKLISEYTKDLDTSRPTGKLSTTKFLHNVYSGKNCPYFFLKKNGKIFPVLPRKYITVLINKWGEILYNHYPSIEKSIEHHEIKIGVELYHFIKQRTNEDNLFFLSSAIQDDLKPHKTIFTTAFLSKDRLILINVIPPSSSKETQQEILESMESELNDAQNLISKTPVKLGLHGKGKMVQFESPENTKAGPKPLVFTILPHTDTNPGLIQQPKNFPGKIIGLDQFLGIIDEIENLDELSEYLDYIDETENATTIFPMASDLDKFATYKDSHKVLVPGANLPDMIAIDPSWGTNFRYRSLAKFWDIFPEQNFFGHPRSWQVKKEDGENNLLTLKSKGFFGYAYHCPIGFMSFFINTPADYLDLEQGGITDLLMRSLGDSFLLYKEQLQGLAFAKSNEKLQALFFPSSLVKNNDQFKHLEHLIPSENLWSMDISLLGEKDHGVRIIFDDQKIQEASKDAKDRTVQVSLLIDVLKQIDSIFPDPQYPKIEKELIKEKTKKNRFRVSAIERRVSFPLLTKYIIPDTSALKIANKKIAEIARSNGIMQGEYKENEAKEKIDSLKTDLIHHLNKEVEKYNLKNAIPILISNIDSLTDEYEMYSIQVENSLDQEVDYDRDNFSTENKQKFLHNHKNYKYLIEKFVQLQPKGRKDLSSSALKELLANIDILLNLYFTSDFLWYGIYPSTIKIEHDFLAKINHGEDIEKMQTDFAKEQAKIELGSIGNKKDLINTSVDNDQCINELDEAFKIDTGFSFANLVRVQQVLAGWAAFSDNTKEDTYYSASIKEIETACAKGIQGYDPSKTSTIIDFLTLDPRNILRIEPAQKNFDGIIAEDLPVWEYRKRVNRYSIKPIIKIDSIYFWGAHSLERSGRIWSKIAEAHSLPADIGAPSVDEVLKKNHDSMSKLLVNKIKEIVERSTKNVEKEIDPFSLKIHDKDIGDIDIFALLKEKNILLNIEAKIIDQTYCNKDLQRTYEKIYGRIKTGDGSFQGGYLQKVETRAEYLKKSGKEIAKKFWGPLQDPPRIVSLFVTQNTQWWTKFPPVETDVNFVEIRLLDDFIKNLLN